MTQPTEDNKDMIQRDVDAEINLINEFLADIDNRRRHMCHFVSGLQVAVTSILFAAVRTLEGKHSKEGKETIQEEEGTTTQACLRKMEESSKKEEEQMDNTLTEDEEASESNLSSELMKSLNNTLGDLEEAEKKLIEMDSQDHTATDGQSSEPCYLDFMYEFLADFRLKLQQSCEEFISLESQALALLEERKALQDLSLQIRNSPRKTMKPKHNSLNTVVSDMETVDKSEDSAISEMKFTLPKDMYQDSIPLDTVAARKDIDSNDGTPFETKSIVPQKDKDKETVPICTNETPQNDTTKDNTSPNTLTNIKQTNDTDVPSHKTPPKAIPGSTTEDSPCDRKESPEQVATDEEYDGPSPVGMRRMFGSFSAEPKIPLPCPSPTISVENSPAFSPSPTSLHIADSLAMKLNNEVSPSDTVIAQKNTHSSGSSPSETRPTTPQKDEGKVIIPTYISATLERDNIERNASLNTHRNITQTNDINAPSNKTPPRDTCSPTAAEENTCDKKEVPEQTEEVSTDEEYDGPSPVGMRRMFGSFSQEPKISLPPCSPTLSVENSLAFSPSLSISLALKPDPEVRSSDTTDAQKGCDSSPSEIRTPLPQKDEDKDTVSTHMSATSEKDNIKGDRPPNINIKQTNDRDVSKKTPPKDAYSPTTTGKSPCDKKKISEQTEEVPIDEEYDGPSPIGMRRMFGSFSQEPKISFPPSSPVLSVENSPAFFPSFSISLALKPDLEISPSDKSDAQNACDSTPSETRVTTPEKDEDKDSVPTHLSATSMEDNIKDDSPPNTQKHISQTNDKDTPNKILPLKDNCLSATTEGSLCGRKEHPEQIVDEKYEELSPRMFSLNYQESKTSFLPPSLQRSENSPIMPQLNLEVSPVSVESES